MTQFPIQINQILARDRTIVFFLLAEYSSLSSLFADGIG